MIRVSSFGRIGQGNDTAVIQRAIEAWSQVGGELYFDSLNYEIDRTINIGGKRQVGGRVTCCSPASVLYRLERDANNLKPQTSVRNLGSRIVWVGQPDRPMITYNGSELDWDGPALWGGYSDWKGMPLAPEKMPASAFEITLDSGMGSGQVRFRQLQIGGSNIGLHANGTGNCDQLQVDRFILFHVDKGYRSESGQNLANLFGYVTASYISDAVFDFEYLAQTTVAQLVINTNVRAVVAAKKSASQGGQFSVLAGKVDGYSTGTQLVDCKSWHSFGHYSFSNFCGFKSELNLAGRAIVTFDKSQHFSKKMIDGKPLGALQPAVVFRGCQIPLVKPHEMIKSGQCDVQFLDCI